MSHLCGQCLPYEPENELISNSSLSHWNNSGEQKYHIYKTNTFGIKQIVIDGKSCWHMVMMSQGVS